ncbi:MAG: hypothetical protein IKP77_01120 [Acholeplasmatales bacterium]|nr:hypothetical protein [Acholeplasmatales bacterium]
MTFEEKIKCSRVVAEGVQKKGYKIKTRKSRWLGIVFSLLIIAYTLTTTILKIKKTDLSSAPLIDQVVIVVSFVAIILKVIFSFTLSIIKKSVYSMNHLGTYNIIEALSNINLGVIFAANFYNYYTLLNIYELWDSKIAFIDNVRLLFLEDGFKTFLFIVTILINVPLIVKLLLFSLGNGLILYLGIVLIPFSPFIFTYIIKDNNRLFYEFEDYDKDYYIVRRRYVEKKSYGLFMGLKKLLLFILIAVGFLVLAINLYGKPLRLITWGEFAQYFLPFIIGYGYIIGLAFLLKIKNDSILMQQKKHLVNAESLEYVQTIKKVNKTN